MIADLVLEHPAILVVGPRATGKTTTCERRSASTLRLADLRERAAVTADPAAAIRTRAHPVLIDEWQLVPETLQTVKEIVDRDPTPGQFLVTGSVRGDLEMATWPGTGRLIRLPMYGLTEREINGHVGGGGWIARVRHLEDVVPVGRLDARDYVELALRSGFPEPALRLSADGRSRWLSSYVEQLVTRDVADLDEQRDPAKLRRYLSTVALNTAGTIADAKLLDAARITKQTARAYNRLLQNLLIVDNLPAWTSNRLKRSTLAPKRHLVDPALMVGILGIAATDVMRDGDLLGRILESFVVAQLRAECALMSLPPRLHHLRTAQGRQEIDIVIEVGARRLLAIEVKASSAPTEHDARHLRWLHNELGPEVVTAVVLHTGPHTFKLDEHIIAAPISTLWS